MTLEAHEFIRRFLIHVLPSGFHRIRHYGLFANGQRRDIIARARALLAAATSPASGEDGNVDAEDDDASPTPAYRCPCCGGRMIVVETFGAGITPRHRTPGAIRIDTS